LTVTTGTITLGSSDMTKIGFYKANLRAKLSNYLLVTEAIVEFSVTLINPCLTTSLALPINLQPETITAFSGLITT
jgi:hypothetical protein